MPRVVEYLWRSEQAADRGILNDPAVADLRKPNLGVVAFPGERLAGCDGIVSRTHCCPRPLTSSDRCAERSSGMASCSRMGVAG
jgi:hypothetical protein